MTGRSNEINIAVDDNLVYDALLGRDFPSLREIMEEFTKAVANLVQTRSRSKVENKKEQERADLDAQSEVQETPIDLNFDTEEVVESESSQPATDTEEEVLNITKEAVSDIAEETDDSESQGHACKKSRSEKREERRKFNLLQNARIGIDEHKT